VGMLRVMSRRGDDRVTWDEQKVSAGDPEAVAAVHEAERIFAQERAKGSTAFRISRVSQQNASSSSTRKPSK